MKVKCSYKELRDIVNLVPHEKNSNNHPEVQIKLLAKILKFQGWRHPVVVSNLSGKVVAGHGRIEAAKLNGWDKIPVDVQRFENEAEEILFLESDNTIAELANHDKSMMIENLKGLDLPDDFDFDLSGLPNFTFDDIPPEIKNTGSELDLDSFDNFDHQCPKCGFEWSDNGSDNS